jgi:hypothetical protein
MVSDMKYILEANNGIYCAGASSKYMFNRSGTADFIA